jgi:8-oxo-dGTP pyrophosphatase MutT (NUDIX family)
MTLLRHVEACNFFDARDYKRFAISGHSVGWIGHENAAFLVARGLASATDSGIGIAGGGFLAVSTHLARIVAAMTEAKLMAPPRGEMTPVLRKWGLGPCAEIDRAGLPALGLPAFGVHVNGLVRTDAGLHLWIGHRARDRQVAPGKLDHLVAGGITMGFTAGETVVKEAEEEAGLSADIARLARPVSQVTYRLSLPEGLRNDTLFIYDLELRPGVVPVGNDGEVERFELMPIAQVIEILRETDAFKFNVNLVLIDFLARHGLIDPDGEPDYAVVIKGLRQ